MKEALHSNNPTRKADADSGLENSPLMEALQSLPKENRDIINADLYARRSEGMPEDELTKRLYKFISAYNHFLDMNSKDSDKKYILPTPLAEREQKAENARHSSMAKDTVRYFEHAKKHKPKRQIKYKN